MACFPDFFLSTSLLAVKAVSGGRLRPARPVRAFQGAVMSCPASRSGASPARQGGFAPAPNGGFSIVEFSVMSVLMGMMMVGTVSWMTSMQRSSNKVQAEASELNFQTFLSETMNPAVCSDTFAGKKIGESAAQIKASSKYCYSESGVPSPNTHGCTADFDRDVPGCDPLQDPLKACSSDTDCGAGNHCESRSSVFWDINLRDGVYGRNFKVMKVRTAASSSSGGSAFALGRANLEVYFSRPGTGFEKRDEGRPCSRDASAGTANQAGCYKLTCPMQLTGSPARGREGSDDVGSCRMLKCGGGTLKITAVAPPIAVLCGGAGTAGSFHSNGGGFVQSTAAVADTAHVGKMAVVCGTAKVEGHAKILGSARILRNATVKDNALVYDNAKVSGSAVIQDNARVYGNAEVMGTAVFVKDSAEVYGMASVTGGEIKENARVYDMAKVSGTAAVRGKARVWGAAQITGRAKIALSSTDKPQVYGNASVMEDAKVYGSAQVFGNARLAANARIYDSARVYDAAYIRGAAQVYRSAQVYGNAGAVLQARIYGNARVSGSAYISQNAQVSGRAFISKGWVSRTAHVSGSASLSRPGIGVSGSAYVSGSLTIFHDIAGSCRCVGRTVFPAGKNRDMTLAACYEKNCSKKAYYAE